MFTLVVNYYDTKKVKELSEGIKTNSNHSSASVLLAMRGLEKDLDMLAKVYENQFVQMRTEMNALAATRNKYSLDNFNLEVKIKDLTHKYTSSKIIGYSHKIISKRTQKLHVHFPQRFDEVKRSNEELIGELNAAKANSNRLMYELDKAKLDAEKTQREKRQLKKDFDELSDQLDEKQKM